MIVANEAPGRAAGRPPTPEESAQAERQMQEMVMVGESLQMEARALDEQRAFLEQLSRDLGRGRATLDTLRVSQGGEEVLLPVGGGTYVRAQIVEPGKVLSSLGSGVVVESSVDDAIARLEERIRSTEQALERAGSELRRVEQDLARLNAVLSRFGG